MRLLPPALVLPVVSLAALSAPIPESERTPDYFPTQVGAKWTCRVSGEPNRAPWDHTFTVTATESKDGATTVTTWREVEKARIPYDRVTISKDGVFHAGTAGRGKERGFVPPLPVLKHPLTTGKTWTWKGTCAGEGRSQTRTVKGVEKVAVPAGSFQAVRVEVVEVRDKEDHQYESTEWHVAGLGCVKSVLGNITEEMTSFVRPK